MRSLILGIMLGLCLPALAATDSRGFTLPTATAPATLDSRGFPTATKEIQLISPLYAPHHRLKRTIYNGRTVSVNVKTPTEIPEGEWVKAQPGFLPNRAIVYEFVNQQAIFYCRSREENEEKYGALIPGSGCYLKEGTHTVRVEQYEILVSGMGR